MLLRSMLVLLAVCSAGAYAEKTVQLSDAIKNVLLVSNDLNGDYTVDTQQGWLVIAFQLECTSEGVLTAVTNESELDVSSFNCYGRPLVRFSQFPKAKPFEITDKNNNLKTNLLKTMYREGFELLLSKFTVAYGGNVRCYINVGTAMTKDKSYCELWK